MGKYSPNTFRPPPPRVERPHPVWRGIGCILMILVPILSFALAEITIQSSWAQKYIPYQLLGYPVMPASLWKLGFLNPILGFLQSLPNLYGIVIFLLFYALLIGALVSVASAFLYRFVGPPRFGPQDAEPPKIRVRSYRR
ncbi:MAG TPA: hypothetical protein VLZ89_03505 [Anaerolineales bacterium]|nr:hypothetical protein [Anaerolineales bacterium]